MSSSRLAKFAPHIVAHKSFVAYIMAGDPNYDAALEIMCALPAAGVDIIELGMPFSDPMADGPIIQNAAHRALSGGHNMHKTLDMVRSFRIKNTHTPVVLMGYYNPIYRYGSDAFVRDAHAAGVDALLIVDMPPEEDAELCVPAQATGLDFIRLTAPTTDDARLEPVLTNISGFLYYVSITGITGAQSPTPQEIEAVLKRIRAHNAYPADLPIMVGFGIKTPALAEAIAAIADGVVIGSILVSLIAQNQDAPLAPVLALTKQLAKAIHKV